MVYGYIRVSTDKQDCENQKLGIESKASALGLCIDKYIEDAGIKLGRQLGSRNAIPFSILKELLKIRQKLNQMTSAYK